MQGISHKLPFFRIVFPDGRDIEFIDPKAQEREVLAKGGTINRMDQYANMQLLYKDPHTAKDDEVRKQDETRGYHESVFKYASRKLKNTNMTVIDIPKENKADAVYALRVAQSLSKTVYLDTDNALSFDEVADEKPAKK